MLTQYEKFKAILREMFQMDQADLDFGIYRIMNAKRDEIEKFLDTDLLPQVSSEFAKYRGTEIEEKKKELAVLEATLRDSGMNPDEAPKVKALREEIAKYGDDEAISNDVFSHLSAFFRRYYDNGDFLSLRRYKKDTYAIPYEGEEVKLHWANADQYYIKTSEYLRDYAFRLADGKRAHFKLVDATEEKDNVKQEAGKERKFKLHEEEPVRIDGNDAYIQFVYLPEKEKQDNLNKKAIELLSAEFGKKLKAFPDIFAPAPTAKNPKRTTLEKHLYSYTARFNFDFFIHKDLGGFLRRELDFYVKNEVLFVDDLDAQDDRKLKSVVAKVKVIKHIAQKIITFLSSLEDFQKKLWLKKKFVVNCGWCVTLDRVPEALYPEIVKNASQRDEWVGLFAIDEIQADLTKPGYSDPLTVEFLRANPCLVLDTKHFSDEFKEKLLASFENLDEACDGVIINSENFQALNLLLEKYREQVKCIYIDPPYNAKSSEIIYKNSYKDSSWLSLMDGRVGLGKSILAKTGVLVVAIDEVEQEVLGQLISQQFPENEKSCVAVVHNPSGQQGDNFSFTHEYAYFVYPKPGRFLGFHDREDDEDIRNFRDVTGDESLRTAAANCFYPIFIKNGKITSFGDVCEDDYHPSEVNEVMRDGSIAIYPIDPQGIERKWRYARNTVESIKDELLVVSIRGRDIFDIKRRKSIFNYKSVWVDSKYSANNHGTQVLNAIMGEQKFSYPKSIFLVRDSIDAACYKTQRPMIVDFFAGSGTTGHAVISLNRDDKGKRKYYLVEMGQYFDTVLKPRIQKVVYSKDWKDGKPVSREGVSHMFKYLSLEGYDDTLDNLVAHRTDGQQKTLEKMTAHAREDYQLSYMLDIETRGSDSLLNIDRFSDPFNYTLKIRKDNELKEQKIDLVETFNYLIGLYVEQTENIRGFKVVRGKLRTGEKTLVIWRNTGEKSSEDLNDFFKKQKYNTLDFEFDLIFVNGDNNLENLKIAEDKWKVRLIEEEFKKRMFEQAGV
jgi:adenine-specific DNA-methyltransferase